VKAIVQDRYGPPEVLELREMPMPRAGPDDVLVRVKAASLHPDVWHVVTGRPYALRLMGAGIARPRNPIPGTDMSGIVEAVGSRVTRFRPGDEIFGETAASSWTNGGAFAEYVAVCQDWIAKKPPNATFEQAASVPTSGFITLLNLRDVDRWPPGRRVLIIGAGGGVGSLALQLAKSRRAHVTAVDSRGKLDLLRALGADEVVDYLRAEVPGRGARYDLIVDVPGHLSFFAFRHALTAHGRYVPIGHQGFGATGGRVAGLLPRFLGLIVLSRVVRQLRGPGVPLPGRRTAIAALGDHLAAGRIVPVIDRTYRMQDVREAMRHLMEDELLGKVVLVP
jgi:NADPH:quinone reductase-like Zn-dependent oxidoreductase